MDFAEVTSGGSISETVKLLCLISRCFLDADSPSRTPTHAFHFWRAKPACPTSGYDRLMRGYRSPVTRQMALPTSSATRSEPSGPRVTPTGRP